MESGDNASRKMLSVRVSDPVWGMHNMLKFDVWYTQVPSSVSSVVQLKYPTPDIDIQVSGMWRQICHMSSSLATMFAQLCQVVDMATFEMTYTITFINNRQPDL